MTLDMEDSESKSGERVNFGQGINVWKEKSGRKEDNVT